MPAIFDNQVIEAADAVAEARNTDVLMYNAPIDRWYDKKVISLCENRRRRPNVILILVTEGGDPNAAYRIGRCLQINYTNVSCYISGFCKSAGTLLALGAHELIFSGHGELGPIDVQMSKKDELWEWQSGLTVTSSLSALNEKAFSAYENFFLETKYKGRGSITLKTALDVAVKLAVGLYSPIFQQIDPMHVGEAARSISIARQYGVRLNRGSHNLKRDTLEILITGFMSHGFVIDFQEAKELFENVRLEDERERKLHARLGDRSCIPIDPESSQPVVIDYVSKEFEETNASDTQGQSVSEPTAEPGIGEALTAAGRGSSGNGTSAD